MFLILLMFSNSASMVLLVTLVAAIFMTPTNLLKTLLLLESLNLFLFSVLSLFSQSLLPFSFFMFVILTFMVCEASLGLGVLIMFSRATGAQEINYSLFKLKKLQTFKVCFIS